jgi:hypothetical protein
MKRKIRGARGHWLTASRLCALCACAAFICVACFGCDDQIHTDIRQGALGVFESALDQAYSSFSDALSQGISSIGSGS